MGSTPASRAITAAGIADIAAIARLLSVMLTASTKPFNAAARRRTALALADFGGLSSAVTTNSPRRSSSENVLNALTSHLSLYQGRSWHPAGLRGCRGFDGPFPQPLWMSSRTRLARTLARP